MRAAGPSERGQLRFQYAATASSLPSPLRGWGSGLGSAAITVTRAVYFTSANSVPGLLDADSTHLHSQLTDDVGDTAKGCSCICWVNNCEAFPKHQMCFYHLSDGCGRDRPSEAWRPGASMTTTGKATPACAPHGAGLRPVTTPGSAPSPFLSLQEGSPLHTCPFQNAAYLHLSPQPGLPSPESGLCSHHHLILVQNWTLP